MKNVHCISKRVPTHTLSSRSSNLRRPKPPTKNQKTSSVSCMFSQDRERFPSLLPQIPIRQCIDTYQTVSSPDKYQLLECRSSRRSSSCIRRKGKKEELELTLYSMFLFRFFLISFDVVVRFINYSDQSRHVVILYFWSFGGVRERERERRLGF